MDLEQQRVKTMYWACLTRMGRNTLIKPEVKGVGEHLTAVEIVKSIV